MKWVQRQKSVPPNQIKTKSLMNSAPHVPHQVNRWGWGASYCTWESTNWTKCVEQILTKPHRQGLLILSPRALNIYTYIYIHYLQERHENNEGTDEGGGEEDTSPPLWMSPAQGLMCVHLDWTHTRDKQKQGLNTEN